MLRLLFIMMCLTLMILTSSCAKPLISGRVVKNVHYWSDDYAATPNEVYYAVRWALRDHGYPIAEERLPEGIITSTWIPVKSDSHCIEMFGRCDYGVTNSYYQLEVRVTSDSGRATVKVGARSKAIVDMQVSSGREEKKILASIGDFLRKFDPDISNLGINE